MSVPWRSAWVGTLLTRSLSISVNSARVVRPLSVTHSPSFPGQYCLCQFTGVDVFTPCCCCWFYLLNIRRFLLVSRKVCTVVLCINMAPKHKVYSFKLIVFNKLTTRIVNYNPENSCFRYIWLIWQKWKLKFTVYVQCEGVLLPGFLYCT